MHRKLQGGTTIDFEVHPELDVLSFKALIEEEVGIGIDEQRILNKGRALRDEDSLELAGVGEGAQLFVTKHSGTPVENINASSFVPRPEQTAANGNDDPMAAMLNSPMMSSMLDNPEMMRAMMQANPQMRALMESNPELAHILNDPQMLRQWSTTAAQSRHVLAVEDRFHVTNRHATNPPTCRLMQKKKKNLQ